MMSHAATGTLGWGLVILCLLAPAARGWEAGSDTDNSCAQAYEGVAPHLVNGGGACFQDDDTTWMFAVHHKTGTQFAKRLGKSIIRYCDEEAVAWSSTSGSPSFSSSSPFHMSRSRCVNSPKEAPEDADGPRWYMCNHWGGDVGHLNATEHRHRNLRVVQFLRDPLDLVLSGYNYHKKGKDRWLTEPLQDVPEGLAEKLKGAKSYQHALQTLDTKDGLLLEAHRSADLVADMARSYCAWKDDPSFLATSSEEFTGEGSADTMCRLLRFLGVPMDTAGPLAEHLHGWINYSPAGRTGSEEEEYAVQDGYSLTEQMDFLSDSHHYPRMVEVREALTTGRCEDCKWCHGPQASSIASA